MLKPLISAKNKKSGEVQSMDKNTWDLYKKMGDQSEYTDYKSETSKSVEQELYETQAGLLYDSERYDDVIALTEKGLAKFPKSTKLAEIQGNAYYKAGKTDDFIKSLKTQVANNPQDKAAYYNLGILASKDPARIEEAKGYLDKALEIDPNYKEALQAMFYNIYMGDDGKVIDAAEAARKAGKMDEFNKIIEDRRERLKKGLPYVERLYALEPDNVEVVSLLKSLYQTTKNDAKYQEFKAKEAALGGGK